MREVPQQAAGEAAALWISAGHPLRGRLKTHWVSDMLMGAPKHSRCEWGAGARGARVGEAGAFSGVNRGCRGAERTAESYLE